MISLLFYLFIVPNQQAAQVEILRLKNGALKVIENKLKHNFQQKREKGKTSYEVGRRDREASGDKLWFQVTSFKELQ